MDSIITIINNTKLTKTQKKLSDYILDHTSEACFMTSMDLAKMLDVSEASVVRFCRALGFSGYIDFQKNLRQQFQQKLTEPFQSMNVPAEKLLKYTMEESEFIAPQYQNTLENLKKCLMDNPHDKITSAVDMILSSRTRYISATRANTALGDYFHIYMKHLLPHIEYTSSAINPVDHMVNITSDDILILFSFPRYSSVDKITLQMANDAGAKVLLITDRPSAALTPYATLVLTAPVDINAFFNSFAAPFFLTEVLLNALSRRVNDTEQRLRKIDKYLDKLKNY